MEQNTNKKTESGQGPRDVSQCDDPSLPSLPIEKHENSGRVNRGGPSSDTSGLAVSQSDDSTFDLQIHPSTSENEASQPPLGAVDERIFTMVPDRCPIEGGSVFVVLSDKPVPDGTNIIVKFGEYGFCEASRSDNKCLNGLKRIPPARTRGTHLLEVQIFDKATNVLIGNTKLTYVDETADNNLTGLSKDGLNPHNERRRPTEKSSKTWEPSSDSGGIKKKAVRLQDHEESMKIPKKRRKEETWEPSSDSGEKAVRLQDHEESMKIPKKRRKEDSYIDDRENFPGQKASRSQEKETLSRDPARFVHPYDEENSTGQKASSSSVQDLDDGENSPGQKASSSKEQDPYDGENSTGQKASSSSVQGKLSWFEETLLNDDSTLKDEHEDFLASLRWVQGFYIGSSEKDDTLQLFIICGKDESPDMAALKEKFGEDIVNFVEIIPELPQKYVEFLRNDALTTDSQRIKKFIRELIHFRN